MNKPTKSKAPRYLAEVVLGNMNLDNNDLQAIVNLQSSPFMKFLEAYLNEKHNRMAEQVVSQLNPQNLTGTGLDLAELKGRVLDTKDILKMPKVAEKVLKANIKSK